MRSPPTVETSLRMRRQRSRDTKLELKVRSGLHRLGFRFRVNVALLPGSRRTADIVFSRQRIAIFLDGCFWHGCPAHFAVPKSNSAWWSEKIYANVERDKGTNELLRREGWKVLRFWEHEACDEVVREIANFIRESRASTRAANG